MIKQLLKIWEYIILGDGLMKAIIVWFVLVVIVLLIKYILNKKK